MTEKKKPLRMKELPNLHEPKGFEYEKKPKPYRYKYDTNNNEKFN